MIRWLTIIIAVGQCYAGSTNWIAQRPGLVSDYGNFFVGEKISFDSLSGLVAWLPFPAPFVNTQYCFAVSCTNDLTISGATWSNNAMVFDGTNDYLIFSSSNSFNFGVGNFSIFAWIKPLTILNNRMVLDKRTPATAGGYALGTVTNTIVFSINSLAGTPALNVFSRGVISTGVWHHIGVVVDRGASVARLYYNGITNNSASIPAVGDISSSVVPVVGQRTVPTSSLTNFYGSIGEIIVYNVAITSNQVLQLYQDGPPP